MATNTVPLTAWEQGGMVVLFALLFVSLITLLLKWFSSQQKSWQTFIEGRDLNWQSFLHNQRAEDNQTVHDLIIEVRSLTGELVQLRKDFDEHNTWERARLEDMTLEPKTQPRRKV